MSVLFLGKKNCEYTDKALAFTRRCFDDVTACKGRWGDPMPEQVRYSDDKIVLSFMSRWVVPEHVLAKADTAINFHPGPPEYPGIGCVNWALYDGATEYGVTCHHMEPDVDSGAIIDVRRFPIFASDDVESLLGRTYDAMLAQFYHVVQGLWECGSLTPIPKGAWSDKRHTREELDALSVIMPDMSDAEIERRIRATNYCDFRPYVTLGGHRFSLDGDE